MSIEISCPKLAQGWAATRLQRPCPVCRQLDARELGRLKYALFDDSPLADEYAVVCCATCGFVSCNTPSSQRDYDRFYEHYYYSPAYLAHQILPEEQRYFADIARTVSPYLKRGREALFDIGCGTGNLLRSCREQRLSELYAIDPSAACIERLRQAGFAGAVGSVSHIPFPDVEPGVIVLAHIVEHILDMPAALRSVHRRLGEHGVVYVEVPDAARYEEFEASTPLRYFYLQHVIHFDHLQLDSLFQAHGFRKLSGGRRVRVENELVMPAVWAIYERGDGKEGALTPDFSLAARVESWFSAGQLDPDGTFAELAAAGCPVYIWGVGIHVQMMLGMSPLRDCNIVCCVDQDPKLHDKMIHGHQITSPEILRRASKSETVVIGSLIHRQKMLRLLRDDFGFRGRVVTV